MRSTFYDVIGVPTHATQNEIAVAVRECLATTWGDERELVINAANTLLDRESRESYDRLNGIIRVRGREQILSDNATELAKYAEAERLRRTESAFVELKWTLNFIALGIVIGLWLLGMFQMVPSLARELDRVLGANGDINTFIACIVLTIPSLVLAFVIMNIFSETLHIVIRYFIICALLAVMMFGLGTSILGSDAAGWVRVLGMVWLGVSTIMFLRYLGIRQLRTIGEIRPARSNRRDQS
jgi:hypothetical protein